MLVITTSPALSQTCSASGLPRITPSGVPVKKMSLEGGDYLAWSADGKSVTWAWGAKFYRQDVGADKPEMTDVVVEAPRARCKAYPNALAPAATSAKRSS